MVGNSDHSGQIAAGRGSPNADPGRVQTIARRICPQKADCRLAVIYRCRKARFAAQPVFHACKRIAAFQDAKHRLEVAIPFGAEHERAAVDVYHQGKRTSARFRIIQVEPLAA